MNKIRAFLDERMEKLVDCPPFSKFLLSSLLKSAMSFMNAEYERSEHAQIKPTYRYRHYHEVNNFKHVQHSIV